MTPDLRDLLTRVEKYLRAVAALFGVLPPKFRATHLEAKADRLADEIDDHLRRAPAEGE